MRYAAVLSREAAPNSNSWQAPHCEQEQAHLREEGGALGTASFSRSHPSASYSTCLDNLVDVMYGRHAQQAQPLPSGSKGSFGSVSWSPAQSLSLCTDSGVSGDYYSRTPCSNAKRMHGGQRHGVTGGYRQVCAADDCIASRLQPPGSAGWQALSGSPAPSRCAKTAEMSPLGVCMLQSACIPDGQQTVLVTTSHCASIPKILTYW
jgi:hypothetical protein